MGLESPAFAAPRGHDAVIFFDHLEAEPFDAIERWVSSFEQLWETRLDLLGDFLATMPDERNIHGSQAR